MAHFFRFDFDRTLESTAFLLRREPGHRMNYMRLLKVLYMAERACLEESGKPLTGSHVVAMKRGPVLEEMLHLIRGSHIKTPLWARYMRTDRYDIEMTDDPGVGHLSRFVTRKLEEVAERFDLDDEWAMVNFTHTLPEWAKNDPGESSRPISLEDILEAIGRLDDVEAITRAALRDARVSDFFREDREPIEG